MGSHAVSGAYEVCQKLNNENGGLQLFKIMIKTFRVGLIYV